MILRSVQKDIFKYIRILNIRRHWQVLNLHNHIVAFNGLHDELFPIDKVRAGKGSYGKIIVTKFTNDDAGLFIGNYCSIAPGTRFLLGGGHSYHHISTYPFKSFAYNEREAVSNGSIVIEDDVWIGTDCIILSGVTLKRGTVVAAGSVVTKSSKPYSLIGGVPANFIKYRFTPDVIEKISKIDFSSLNEDLIKKKMDLFYIDIDSSNVDTIVDSIIERK